MVALRTPNLVQVQLDPDLQVMGMLVDRRDELGRARTQTINRLHRLLLELFPGGAKQFLSARQARALIDTPRAGNPPLVGTCDGCEPPSRGDRNSTSPLTTTGRRPP